MKIFVPHPYHDEDRIMQSNSGASLSGFNHVRALSKYCDVYMPAAEAVEYRMGVHGIRPAFETIESSQQWFAKQNFDAVLMFEPRPDDLAFYRHVCSAPIVIRLSCSFGHNRDFMDKVLGCYSLLRPHDALSPKSTFVATEVARCIYDPSYLQPITNGVNADVFKPTDKLQAKKDIAAKVGDQRFLEMPVAGFVGRFEPSKGAYSFLRMADLNPDVLFVVVGKQFSPVAHPPNVIFLGAQPYDQMPQYYNMLDVLCALSVYSYESCPSTVLEGMACGLPIVSTDFSGASELLGDCGRFIDVNRFEDEPMNICGYVDPEKVSDAMREFLESKAGRLEMGDPVTMSFTQGCEYAGGLKSVAKGFNHLGNAPGPLPRIPFLSQDMSILEGLGLHLMQHLHPNEVEAALLGICSDRDTAHKTLRKIQHFSDMLTAL